MSLASDFAAALANDHAAIVTTTATRPAPFTGPNGQLQVTDTGDMVAVPGPGISSIVIPAAGIPAIIAWLTATFI